MSGKELFYVWDESEGRDSAREVRAWDAEEAAEEYANSFDGETTRVSVCVALAVSDEFETFDLEVDYSRDWVATLREPPLEAFGWALSQVPRWEAERPRREAERAALRAELAEFSARRELYDALCIVSQFGRGIAAALTARDALRDLLIDDEDHASAFAIYAALAKIRGGQR